MWEEGRILQFGKYRIDNLIGQGGFGLTYIAEDLSLQRRVVLKVPNKLFRGQEGYEKFVDRFKREGQILSKVSHPNVVEVKEYFEEDKVPCLVLSYIAGDTLSDLVHSKKNLSENQAFYIFNKLLNALSHIHSKGIIHCDIHPRNILIRSNGEPVLIDFGSSKKLESRTSTFTTTFNDFFTPYDQGKGEAPKAAWDIYALAATMYFSVTGTPPQPAVERKFYNADLETTQLYKAKLSDWFKKGILLGLSIEERDRPSSTAKWLEILRKLEASSKDSPYQVSSPRKQQALSFYSIFLLFMSSLPTGFCMSAIPFMLTASDIGVDLLLGRVVAK